MINLSKRKTIHTYISGILAAIFFAFPSSLLSNPTNTEKTNNNKKEFFKILSTKIPKTRNIVYISENYGNTPITSSKPISTVKAMKEDGSDSISIIEGEAIFSIQVSPDKNKLLLIVPDHSPEKNENTDWLNSHIWLYSNGRMKQLTSGKVMDSDAVWSPSGDKIYFTRSEIFIDIISGTLTATEGNVWMMNIDGSKPLQLTTSQENIANTTPAPIKNSKKILFTSNRNGKWQMFTMDEDGLNQKLFIDNGMFGRWSPDGEFLAFMDSSPGDIYLASKDGGLIKRLTKEGDVDFSPTWSPDSQYLTYGRINNKAPLEVPLTLHDAHFSENGTHSHEEKDNKNMMTYIPKGFLQEEPYSDIWKLSITGKNTPKRLTNEGLNNSFPQWISQVK